MEQRRAELDRRIEVVVGTDDQKREFGRISHLRGLPHVVLLGEPGTGKSTVFEAEAEREGALVFKARQLINGGEPEPDRPLFIDALDEYRSDGSKADKVHLLAAAIQKSKANRWWLSCRSEDWRHEADISAITASATAPILVAQLRALEVGEAEEILRARGEPNPQAFMRKAHALAAHAFTETPLSLTLLQKAVAANGDWPATRFDLFASGVRRLAHENNTEHKYTPGRAGTDVILQASGELFLTLLLSGARAVWRTHDEPPGGSDARAFVMAHSLGFEPGLLEDVLDTALFRGEGQAFEPFHRTVAEFLAAEALARRVQAADGRAALPLRRAVALLTVGEGQPPTELRGLYAWFAAHLAQLGRPEAAEALIRADAFTVLAYSDAAAFETSARRCILNYLDNVDPFFRQSEHGVVALGGLSGVDLVDDFEAILRTGPTEDHLLITVYDALSQGHPLLALSELLRNIALDQHREEWDRRRAMSIYLKWQHDSSAARLDLLSALEEEPVSRGREVLRARLLAELAAEMFSLERLRDVLRCYHQTPEDHTIGHLYPLQVRLEREPVPGLFDQPVGSWLVAPAARRPDFEVRSVLERALAAAIQSMPPPSAEAVWLWLTNIREWEYSQVPEAVRDAVRAWIERSASHGLDLAIEIVRHDDPSRFGPWWVGDQFKLASGLRLPKELAAILLKEADEASSERAARLRLIAAALVSRSDADEETYWAVYEKLFMGGAEEPCHPDRMAREARRRRLS